MAHTWLKAVRVWSVSTQTARPRPRVKMAQKTTSQPWARNQPRLVGRKRPGRDRRKVTKTKMAFTTPAVTQCQSFLLLLSIHVSPLLWYVGSHSRTNIPTRHRSEPVSTVLPFPGSELVIPVSGHWPSSRFCMTLSTVGVSRMRCSEVSEKPNSSPPHPAKTKSSPTKIIINLVGILAVGLRENDSCVRLQENCRMESRNRKEWNSSAEPAGVLSQRIESG